MNFYPRSPYGERPNLQRNQHQRKKISIHALLTESDTTAGVLLLNPIISIHALLTESDGKVKVVEPGLANISIHALLTESDIIG